MCIRAAKTTQCNKNFVWLCASFAYGLNAWLNGFGNWFHRNIYVYKYICIYVSAAYRHMLTFVRKYMFFCWIFLWYAVVSCIFCWSMHMLMLLFAKDDANDSSCSHKAHYKKCMNCLGISENYFSHEYFSQCCKFYLHPHLGVFFIELQRIACHCIDQK